MLNALFILRLNKIRQSTVENPLLVALSRSYLLAVRFVERNQKGNYFRETQYAGRSVPVSSIGWLWSNGVLRLDKHFRVYPQLNTHSRLLSSLHSGKVESAPRRIPSPYWYLSNNRRIKINTENR